MKIWLAKIIAKKIIKAIKHKHDLRKIDEYVNKPNILDKQIKQIQKNQAKILKNQEKYENDLASVMSTIKKLKRFK
jgi:ribonucleotide reductase alpha subunit